MIPIFIYLLAASLVVWRTKKVNRIFLGAMLFGILLIFIPYDKFDGLKLLGYQITINDYGSFGDFVGGIAATYFSGFAVYLLYVTYNSQKEELAATRDIMSKQNSVLVKQQFDNTFFNLLSSANEMTNEISYNNANGRTIGKLIFRNIMNDYDRFSETHLRQMVLINIADAFFREEQPNVALWSSRPYLQSISLMVELVEDNVDTNDQSKYFQIILSTFNTRQIQFIDVIANTAIHNIVRIDRLRTLVSHNPRS